MATTNDDRDSIDRVTSETDPTSTESGFQPGRRKAMIVGALLVPRIVTLHGTPAWAQTDYTMTAYRYGDNAGLCRNPEYDPNADPNTEKGQEFVECRTGRTHDDFGRPPQRRGPGVF